MEKNKSVCIANVKLSIDEYSLRCVQPHFNKCNCKKLVCSEQNEMAYNYSKWNAYQFSSRSSSSPCTYYFPLYQIFFYEIICTW